MKGDGEMEGQGDGGTRRWGDKEIGNGQITITIAPSTQRPEGWYTSATAGPFNSHEMAEAFWTSFEKAGWVLIDRPVPESKISEPPALGIRVSDEAVPRDRVGG